MTKFKYEIGEYVVQASRASFQEKTRELKTIDSYFPITPPVNPETYEVITRIMIESKYYKGEQHREYGVRSMNMSFGGVVNVPEDDLMSLDEYRTVMKLGDDKDNIERIKLNYQVGQQIFNSKGLPIKPPTSGNIPAGSISSTTYGALKN